MQISEPLCHMVGQKKGVPVNEHYGKNFSLLDSVVETDGHVKEDIEMRFDELGQEELAHIKPLPNEERAIVKEEWRKRVVDHGQFKEARRLFDAIMKRTAH